MEDESQPNFSSSSASASDCKSAYDTEEVEEPSMRKEIVVKRSTPDEKRIFYRRVLGSEKAKFQDPLPFKNKNSELFLKKYSKEKHIVKDYLEDTLNKMFSDLPISEFSNVLSCDISNEILSRLFIVSAYTIRNYFGRPGPKSADSNDLYLYTHKLFSLGTSKENENFEIVKNIHPPEFWIYLYILEASGFGNGSHLSYVYCKACMENEPKLVEMTKLVQKSNHPVWNVRFCFSIKNLKTDVINMEMRESEKDFVSEHSHLQNLKEISKTIFNKNHCDDCKCENCDLVGKAEVNVCDVYSEGIDEWIPLTSTGREIDISLHVRIKFEASEPQMRSRVIKRHILLLRTCVHDRLTNSNKNEKIYKWETFLDRCALTLIFLHSVISHLTESEDILCRFVVIANLGIKSECISHEFFYHLLHETLEHLKQFPNDYIENRLQLMYDNELQNLCFLCFKFISSLHSYNLVEDKQMVLEFEFSLKTIYLLQNILDLTTAPPLMTLRSEAINWMEKKSEEMMAEIPENRQSYIKQFLDYLLDHQKTLDETVSRVFPDETYTLLTYKDLDTNFMKPLKLHILELSRIYRLFTNVFDDEGIVMEEGIEIFLKMKQLLHYISETVHVSASNLEMGGFRGWFGYPIIKKWFEWRQMKADKEIAEFVAADDLEPVDIGCPFMESFKVSISAGGTCEAIDCSLKELWNLVSFPRSNTIDELFVNSLHSCCMSYAVLLKALVSSRRLIEEFYSGGKTCLCILSNNLWSVSVYAGQTIFETVGTLPSNLPHSRLSLEDSCREICSCVADKYLADIVRILRDILKDEVTDKENDFTQYGDYLKKIVWGEMFVYTSFDVFVIFLTCLVSDLLKILKRNFEQYAAVPRQSEEQAKALPVYQIILNETKEICSISDDSDANALVWNACALDMLSELERNS